MLKDICKSYLLVYFYIYLQNTSITTLLVFVLFCVKVDNSDTDYHNCKKLYNFLSRSDN